MKGIFEAWPLNLTRVAVLWQEDLMDTYTDTDETLQPELTELSGESLLTTDYLGVRANTFPLHTPC